MPQPPDYRKPEYRPPPLIDQPDLFTDFDDPTAPPPPPVPRLPPIDVAPTGQRAQTAQDVAIDLADNDIYGKWLAFHLNNPHVYKALRELSLDASGHRQVFGIAAIVEIARWERRFTTQGEDYKMPNAFRSMYSRLLMESEPDLYEFFNTSELRSAYWPTDAASVKARAESVA